MATIPNFPQRFLSEHAAWHRNMSMGMTQAMGQHSSNFIGILSENL